MDGVCICAYQSTLIISCFQITRLDNLRKRTFLNLASSLAHALRTFRNHICLSILAG